MMKKKAYSLMKSLKDFRIYVLHSKVISFVPLAFVKDILNQPDIDGRRSKWISQLLEFILEINPTKLVKGQGLAKLLDESNCRNLGVNFIRTCSEYQQGEFSHRGPQVIPPLKGCIWCKDIIFFLQEL
jgi:hypothetical protein